MLSSKTAENIFWTKKIDLSPIVYLPLTNEIHYVPSFCSSLIQIRKYTSHEQDFPSYWTIKIYYDDYWPEKDLFEHKIFSSQSERPDNKNKLTNEIHKNVPTSTQIRSNIEVSALLFQTSVCSVNENLLKLFITSTYCCTAFTYTPSA